MPDARFEQLAPLAKHAPAANTAAVVSIAAQANKRTVIWEIEFGYNADPTNGSLSITSGGVDVIAPIAITEKGPKHFSMRFGLHCGKNEEVVVTLAAGGADVTGHLNVQYT